MTFEFVEKNVNRLNVMMKFTAFYIYFLYGRRSDVFLEYFSRALALMANAFGLILYSVPRVRHWKIGKTGNLSPKKKSLKFKIGHYRHQRWPHFHFSLRLDDNAALTLPLAARWSDDIISASPCRQIWSLPALILLSWHPFRVYFWSGGAIPASTSLPLLTSAWNHFFSFAVSNTCTTFHIAHLW